MSKNILETIQRLLALSQSDNVNEAATAAATAQVLMTRHKIEMSDLAFASGEETEAVDDTTFMATKSYIPWKTGLVTGLAAANGCETYIRRLRLGENKTETRIIGTKSAMQTIRYMFEYLVREIDRLANEERANDPDVGRSWLRDFRLGATTEIVTRLKEASAQTIAQEASGSSLAIIDREKEKIDEVVRKLHLRPAGNVRLNDIGAYGAGVSAGKTVRLNNGPALGKGSSGNLR